jgi:hypothetical protein
MIGVLMKLLVLYTAMSIFSLSQVFQHLTASKRFPNEDPRRAWAKLPWQTQVLPLLILAIVYAGVFVLAKTLNLLAVYQGILLIVFAAAVTYHFVKARHWNKQFGNPVQNVKVANIPVMTLFIGLMLFVGIAAFLIGLLKLPAIYLYLTFVIFIALFVSIIVWGRKSMFKSQK